ncbi:MAG: hypothetical protein IPH26_05035 [Sterolibacteriaceae bacterium]|uniref:DUF4124 domain-containing protein n=1 Tax=Candidatus Methylophosphatis roskildensis TaxID=2899263 RepID=A0A9D7E715_9PROT|nr:hypothetical protein [Candidatus Methylophosphatis roskildensis]MBK7235190.1 hypothetical protein [Sterolibacteriaceae bacterium]
MPRFERIWVLAVQLIVAAMPGAGSAWAQQSTTPKQTYCCNDSDGVQICSDRLPHQCYNRAYRVMEGSTVVRREEAPLSAEQRRQRIIEDRRQLEEDRARREGLRRDRILIDTYNSVQDIDVQRERAIKEIEHGMLQAKNELVELEKQRQALVEETEFYRRKTMPAELRAAIRANEADIAAQQSIVDSKKKDIDAVNARYDEDKRRYIHLLRNAPRAAE